MTGLIHSLREWTEGALALRLGSVLLHLVWQGAVVAIAAWTVMRATSRARPSFRYAVLLGLFGLMAALPVATYFTTVVETESRPSIAVTGAGSPDASFVLPATLPPGVAATTEFGIEARSEIRIEAVAANLGIGEKAADRGARI